MVKELKDMTVAEANASGQGQAYSNIVAGYGAGVPNTLPSPTIPVNSLTTPVKPIVLPPTKPTPITTGNLGGNVDSTLAGVGADLSTAPTEDPATKSVTDSMNKFLGTEGQEDITVAKEEEIAKKRAAVKIQNELTAMDKAYRDEVNEIKKNPEGKLAGGIQSQVNDATDRYNNNRANVSIAYNTAIGDYNSAQETVALKTQAYTDRKDAEYKAWEMNYKMASDFMTPAQKQEAELLKAKKLQDIQDLSGAKNTVMANMLQNGAPQSVWNAVDTAASKPNATVADIMSAAGQYGIDKYQQAQTAKLQAELSGTSGGGVNTFLQDLIGGKMTPEQGKMTLSSLVASGDLTSTAAKFIGENSGIIQTTQQKVADAKLQAMVNNTNQLITALEKVPVGGEALGATIESWIPFREASDSANAVKVYNSLRGAFTGPVARVISMEVGVLTDKDIKRSQDVLPAVGDNAVVRAEKIKNINQAIANLKAGSPLSKEGQEWYRTEIQTPAGLTDLSGLNFSL
jgi:hypothetical protein